MRAETKTVGINVPKEGWEDEPYNEYVRRLLDNDLMHEIFDEIMKGGKQIVTVSELRIDEQNSINMVSARRDINIKEVVCCADCKHWTDLNGGFCDIWDQCISNAEFFCACGERGEADGRVHFRDIGSPL